jgi:hypothetical protein
MREQWSVCLGGWGLGVVDRERRRTYASVMLDAFLDDGADLKLSLQGGRHWNGWFRKECGLSQDRR